MNERLKKRLESIKAPLETHFILIKASFHMNLWFLMPLGIRFLPFKSYSFVLPFNVALFCAPHTVKQSETPEGMFPYDITTS